MLIIEKYKRQMRNKVKYDIYENFYKELQDIENIITLNYNNNEYIELVEEIKVKLNEFNKSNSNHDVQHLPTTKFNVCYQDHDGYEQTYLSMQSKEVCPA